MNSAVFKAALVGLLATGGVAHTQDGAPARSTRHALVIGIGTYEAPAVPPLEGVVHDVQSAKLMARAMGVADDHIRVLQDSEATEGRIRAEIEALADKVQPGDRAFVYFSGHGTRTYDPQVSRNTCTEGLLTYDTHSISNVEMGRLLRQVSAKSEKLFVFYDACFSGGVADAGARTRRGAAFARFTPKFSASDAESVCARPTNVRTRSLELVMREAGEPVENIVHVGSARPDEVSFDNAAVGGLATSAWRDCMLGGAKDVDRSGGITVSEIAACAQARLDASIAPYPQILAQHITVGGNGAYVPARITPAQDIVERGAGVQPAPTATPADVLREIHQQRNGARFVDAKASAKTVKIGQDTLGLKVTSLKDGYVYVAMAGSDGKSLYLLFPNELDGDNRIKAGQTLELPRKRWEAVAAGPVGKDVLLVLVSDSPRRMSQLPVERSGPFAKTLFDERSNSLLQEALTLDGSACGRDTQARCLDAYGSALVEVEETR